MIMIYKTICIYTNLHKQQKCLLKHDNRLSLAGSFTLAKVGPNKHLYN